MLTLNDGRSELWQWDTGRALSVDADCSQVHFSNKVFGRSIDVDVANGVAIIPDILLQTDNDLNVWAFVGTAENGYTKISKTFKVNRRNKPADYVFTPTDQMTLQTIQSQIGDLADLTTEAKDTLVAAINEAARTGGGGGGSTIELDTTLTQSGKAADAKAVGDRLDSLSEEKVSLPKAEDGTAIPGTAGWYAVSDGAGGITWVESAPSTGGGGETTTHGIVWNLVNVTSSNNAISVADGASLVAVLTPADGYSLGDVTITMGGEVVTGAWNADTATVTIQSVTGDVVISCAGVEQGTGEVIDTSPVIAHSGYAYRSVSTTSPNVTLTAKAGMCVTKIYEFTPNIAAIEAHPSYDAGLGYINAASQIGMFTSFLPNQKYLESGATDPGTTYKKAAYFVDGELQKTICDTVTTQSAEGTSAGGLAKNVLQKSVNGIAFTLFEADAEDSYAYWTKTNSSGKYQENAVLPVGVNDGDIIFAGKNTPYYGMTNINGTTGGGSPETANGDTTVSMASFDRVYTDTGEYTKDLQPKWDGMFSIHRGYSTAPNNTLQAIWEAKKHGYNCCELDVRYTSDNQVVLSHNATVTGTVDGVEVTYTIADTPLATLQTVCIGNTAFPDAKVCSLEDAMRLCRRIGMRPEIDYKVSNEQLYKDCVALSMKYGLQDDTLHCCYGMSYALAVKAEYEKANLRVDGALLDSDTSLDKYIPKPGNLYAFYSAAACGKTDGSNVGANVDNETRILTHKAKGYKMYVWNVTPNLLPDVMQWEPDILQPQSAKDTSDWYTLIRALNSFDGLIW